MEKEQTFLRNVYWTLEFKQFYEDLPEKVKLKYNYVIGIVKTERIISTKFVKRLENTDLYEMRVSLGNNEYRTILFTMDNANVMLAKEITLLHAFLKKSTKDYKNQIRIAENILNKISHEED